MAVRCAASGRRDPHGPHSVSGGKTEKAAQTGTPDPAAGPACSDFDVAPKSE